MNKETREIYERAGWGGELSPGVNPAILVVDFTNGFTNPEFSLGADLSSAVDATRSLVEAARKASTAVPIIFTTIEYDAGLGDAGLWPRKCPSLVELSSGSHAVEVDERIGKQETDMLITKKGASAFFGTDLVAALGSAGVDTVILCGASTSGCVRATAVDLMQHGFVGLVPRECVGDRSRSQHESNLFDIHSKYADVVTLPEVLRYLRRVDACRLESIN